MIELAGLALAGIIGTLLGLLGGGGSILAVPVFVYILGLDPKVAIATSLGVVGLTSLLAAWPHYRSGNVDLRRALLFAVGSAVGAFIGAYLSRFVSGTVQLLIFGAAMLAAAYFMFRGRRETAEIPGGGTVKVSPLPILAQGLGVGILTGLVGVGGGFMIVPALVLLGGVEMKRAVGTSLLVIAINSAAGITGYLLQEPIRDAIAGSTVGSFNLIPFLLLFTALMGAGAVAGAVLSRRINAVRLRRGFALLLVVMAGFILVRNILEISGGAESGAGPADRQSASR